MNKLINYVLNTQQMLKSVTKTLANAETVAGKKTVNWIDPCSTSANQICRQDRLHQLVAATQQVAIINVTDTDREWNWQL